MPDEMLFYCPYLFNLCNWFVCCISTILISRFKFPYDSSRFFFCQLETDSNRKDCSELFPMQTYTLLYGGYTFLITKFIVSVIFLCSSFPLNGGYIFLIAKFIFSAIFLSFPSISNTCCITMADIFKKLIPSTILVDYRLLKF